MIQTDSRLQSESSTTPEIVIGKANSGAPTAFMMQHAHGGKHCNTLTTDAYLIMRFDVVDSEHRVITRADCTSCLCSG